MDTGRDKKTKKSKPRALNRLVGVLLALIFTSTILFTLTYSTSLSYLSGSAALFSAKLTVPQGAGVMFSDNLKYLASLVSPTKQSGTSSRTAPSQTGTSSRPPSSSSSQAASSIGIFKPVKTLALGAETDSSYESYASISVQRLTTQVKSADIKSQLAIKPDIKINLKSTPQVMIIHTHTTESFSSKDASTYDPSAPTRDTDQSKDVVRVGDEIAKYLEQNGIGVYHDTSFYDYPDLDGAYDRSLAATKAAMKKYPTIKVVLDIHRDFIQQDDGTRIKPTTEVNGKKAAQIIIVSGCGEVGSSKLTVPDWKWNYRFALRLQQQLNQSSPGLARPIQLVDKQYNQQVSHGSLMVNVGTDVSTLDEAIYSGQLLGQSLAAVLKGLQ